MELQELHDKLISEGCNRFCIEGIGEQVYDDVERLGMVDGKWAVYYIERGQKSTPFFSTTSKDDAIDFYYDHIKNIEHWHIVAFTRSAELKEKVKTKLEQSGIRVIQNDIPDYASTGDCVYRIFVTNGDIFKAEKLFEKLPYVDEDLKH